MVGDHHQTDVVIEFVVVNVMGGLWVVVVVLAGNGRCGRRGDGGRPIVDGGRGEAAVRQMAIGAGASRSSKKRFTYVQRYSLVQRFAFALLEGAQQQLAHALAEVAAEEGVQQRIDAGIEVGDEKRERREECVEVGVAFVGDGPICGAEHREKVQTIVTK